MAKPESTSRSAKRLLNVMASSDRLTSRTILFQDGVVLSIVLETRDQANVSVNSWDLFPQPILLGYFCTVLAIIGNRLMMIWVLSTERTPMPRSARPIRVVDLRLFLRCYAAAGNLLHNVIVSHIAILCSRTNDQTIALTRNTSTWWWTLQDVHQMGFW